VSALFTQGLVDTVQTVTGKVDPARKFKCTTAARGLRAYFTSVSKKTDRFKKVVSFVMFFKKQNPNP